MRLSVIIPVYNEESTIKEIIQRVKDTGLDLEIIVVDDASIDGTPEKLKELKDEEIIIVTHSKNKGKGAAIRTGLNYVSGDIVIIQDADLEYDPRDYETLIRPIVEDRADVVYGSRFLGEHRIFLFWHYIGNKFLTFLANLLYNTMLSDMEVGYKAFKTEVIKGMELSQERFGIEPEITAKVFKRGYRVFEVPITYSGRGYDEGKKITWKDGIWAIWCLIKYRFVD
jgi:glycosyltransferase involved in cell wall biosynthesis